MSSLTTLSERRARGHASQAAPRLQARGPVAPVRASGLSGLTADERGVHDILIDSLKRVNRADDTAFGLTRAEKEHLTEALDIPFLDAGIARMIYEREVEAFARRMAQVGAGLGLLLGLILIVVSLVTGWPDISMSVALTFLMGLACVHGLFRSRSHGAPSERQQIYESLRQLALLVDSGATPDSEALRRADRLIDTLALADIADTSGDRAPRRVRA